jgi:uncharacterized protein
MDARPFINSLEFARNGQQISGEVAVAHMQRLADVLGDTAGVLRYSVQGNVDRQGVAALEVSVTGQCWLQCQRCLEAMQYPIAISTRLLLRDQAGLDALDDDEEAFDSILAQARLDVVDMIEEEILLSLPIAPKHDGQCQPAASGNLAQADKSNPFAVLEKLKHH